MELPDAELAVLEALWRDAPQSAEQLTLALAATRAWKLNTVKTLLTRMQARGAVRHEKEGRRFLYWPVWERRAFLTQATRQLLDSFFGGKVTPLVAHLSSQRKLSAADRRALRELLDSWEQN